MGQLRDQMGADLLLAGLRPHTRRSYLGCARRLAAFHRRSPAEMGIKEVRAFLLHLVRHRHVQPASRRVYGAALRILFATTLGRPEVARQIPMPRAPRRVPQVLSGSEVQRLLAALSSARHRTILSLTYGVGLRISEAHRCSDSDRPEASVSDVGGGRS